MFLQWTDDLAIGVEEIDAHHKALVSIVNDLQEAFEADRGDAVVGDILIRLTEYVGYHFDREEQFMRASGYPDLEAHHDHHDRLMQQLGELVYRYEVNNHQLTEQTLAFVKTWLVNHLMDEDRKIGLFLKQKGL